MRRILILKLCFLSVTFAFGQKEAAIWYFGQNAGLDFNSGTPVALTNGELTTTEGCASISDSDGNLLFYTDGVRVWDRTHQVMPNGNGLYGDATSTQSAIIVPRPDSTNRFYIFTVDQQQGNRGLNYSELDMTLNGGLGDITALKNFQLTTPTAEKITAVKHTNNVDIWVITHGRANDTFLAYLVTATGVGTTPVISNVGINLANYDPSLATVIGYLKASPDGTKLAASHYYVGTDLLSFDSLTGVVSNAVTLKEENLGQFYGVEFSPNSQMLYLTDNFNLMQFDTEAPDIAASEVVIYNVSVENVWGLQLGIDGKIYLAKDNHPYLDVIHNPDAPGLACNHEVAAVDLQGRMALLGLPPFIQSYFLTSFNAANFCLGDATEFSVNTTGTITHMEWDFGDGTTSSLEQPSHVYAAPGTYTVSVTVNTPSATKTDSKDIIIYPTPIANIITDFEVCSVLPQHLFDLATKNAELLGGQLAAENSIAYYPTQVDAQNETNPLPSLYTNTLSNETVHVRITNINNPSCYALTSFQLVVTQAPVVSSVMDWVICDPDLNGLYSFDLSEKDTEVLGGQSPIDFDVAYFLTEQDAFAGQNPIVGTFQNTSSPQQLFYRIQNRNNAACFLTDSFSLHVFDAPIAYASEPLILCDTNGTGILSIDLSPKDVEVLGGQDPNFYRVSYFSSEQDAVTNTNVLSKQNYNNTELQETLFARIQHRELTFCYEVTHFSLTINPLPIPALQEVYVICPDSPELVLDVGDFESWVWEDAGGAVVGTSREFNVAALGGYSLTVSQTNSGVSCENTLFFEVVSSGAPEDFTATVDGFSDQVSIAIETIGVGDFEYSIDGQNYQDQNRFVVFPGEYTVYVRDKFLCRTLSKEIIALGYQKFFTPNGDDIHEHWNVIGADSFPEAQVYIYDRYGKLLQQLSPTDPGWDGTFKGTPLPSTDYWFRFIYGNGKVFSGHFSLKR